MSDVRVNRCIMIIPEIVNMDVIEGIREKYDPNFKLVRPHITLVFPFESNFTAGEVETHVHAALQGLDTFTVTLQGISQRRGFGNYLLLNVHMGKETLRCMHTRLYTGALAPFRPQWARTFEPHMTVGRIADPAQFADAVDATKGICELFSTCVREVAVEVIRSDGGSIIESVVTLPPQ